MSDSDIFFATATELGRMLRAHKVSSVELTRLFLDRLATLGPRYNALAELTPDLALAQARRADRARLKGGAPSSPLLGIPYGAKDLLATKNIPTRWGAPPFRRQVFDYDATVIRKMRDAGAVLLGKLAMVELAGGGGYAYPSASLHGPGLNPWNPEHWAGGSSSGSGGAVAAGLVPFALGSETNGSIMGPSAFCGITGLRPTWGLVSRYGAMELAWSMDKVGPMAHSAEDCGWILQAMAGDDPSDFTTRGHAFRFQPRASKRDFRLGVLPADFSEEPEGERAFEDALRVLRKLGMRIVHTDVPECDYRSIAGTIIQGEFAAAQERFIKSKKIESLVEKRQWKGARAALKISAAEYVRALKQREEIAPRILAMFDEFDALLSPSHPREAPAVSTNLFQLRRRKGSYSVLGALFGVPTLSVPIGFGRQGLPLGLSITGNLFDENTILQIGMLYQRETDWHRRRPPMLTPPRAAS